jgi:hypothetical protein
MVCQEFESFRARQLPNSRQGTRQEHQGSRRRAIARLGGVFSSFDPTRTLRDGALTMRCLAFNEHTEPVA